MAATSDDYLIAELAVVDGMIVFQIEVKVEESEIKWLQKEEES